MLGCCTPYALIEITVSRRGTEPQLTVMPLCNSLGDDPFDEIFGCPQSRKLKMPVGPCLHVKSHLSVVSAQKPSWQRCAYHSTSVPSLAVPLSQVCIYFIL